MGYSPATTNTHGTNRNTHSLSDTTSHLSFTRNKKLSPSLNFQGGSTKSKTLSFTNTMTQATLSSDVDTTTTSKDNDKSIESSVDLLDALRNEMKKANVDAYIVPSDDPHLSEYVAEAYGRRAFLSGFDGSAGTALVTEDNAYLWTDSRYWNQANLQLDSKHWQLMKAGKTETPTIPKFIAELAEKKFKDTSTVFRLGLDPYVHP